uniref:Gustatory receptor n=1 Tax=Glossina brevipalpis TaxID=37001 RepID=A0A1A9WEQ6_9MUSC
MDIIESISVLQIVYQLANLSPWILDKKTWSFVPSRTLEVYTTIVIIGSTSLMLYSLFTDDNLVKASDNEIGQTVDSIQMVGIRMAHIASVLESLIRKNDQKKFYDELKEIDRIFENSLGITLNNHMFRRKTINRGIAMFLIYMLSEFFILASKLITTKHNFFLFWMFYLLPMLICGIRYFQIFTSILIIKERLNELIRVLSDINLTTESSEEMQDYFKNATSMRTITTQNQSRYIFSPKHQQQLNAENSQMNKLVVVRNIYDRLYMESVIACSAIWSVPHLLNVLVLAFICERTVHSTIDMALILHRINSNFNNNKYSSAIVGATTTYLIILIQFHLNEIKPNTKS